MKRVISLILLTILLTSCSATPMTATVGTTKPTAAVTPIATETPVSSTGTSIAEVVPTQQELPQQEYSIDELVASFGLKETPGYEDRTFSKQTINGVEYVVDGYNNVPKLVNENGTWRELDYDNAEDAEVMYGVLAPVGGGIYKDGSYIYDSRVGSSSHPDSLLIAPNFTGDWVVTETQYKGETISLYKLVNVQNVRGGVRVVELAWDSPDVQPAHLSEIGCATDRGEGEGLLPGAQNEFAAFMLPDALKALKVGEPVGARVWKSPPPVYRFNSLDIGVSDSLYNTEQWVLMTELLADDPAAYSLSADAYAAALADGSWPSEMVTLALDRGPAVVGESIKDCFATFAGWRSASENLDEIK